LRAWNRRWSADSIATGLAVGYGEALWRSRHGGEPTVSEYQRLTKAPAALCLAALDAATAKLEADFGTWRTPWGEQNRLQRLDDSIPPHFSDTAPSIPVAFTSAQWGSLASVTGPRDRTTRHRFGTSGNSFVAVVEFGPRVAALAVTAGGESGDPASPHFNDEAARFAAGSLRPVYFYPAELAAHTERRYAP
jgi:acyl-homoserine-lactone acylase